MDMSSIKRMDEDVLTEYIEKMLSVDAKTCMAISEGHLHVHYGDGTTDGESVSENDTKKVISRMIKENKQFVSVMPSEEECLDLIELTVYSEAKNIARWLQSKYDREHKEEYYRFIAEIDMGETTGAGFEIDKNGNFIEKTGHHIRVVIERDMKNITPCGFKVITGYTPMDIATPTGKVIGHADIEKMRDEIFDNNLMKLYYEAKRCADFVDWITGTNAYVYAKFNINKTQFIEARIKEEGIKAFLYTKGIGREKADRTRLTLDFLNVEKMISKIEDCIVTTKLEKAEQSLECLSYETEKLRKNPILEKNTRKEKIDTKDKNDSSNIDDMEEI